MELNTFLPWFSSSSTPAYTHTQELGGRTEVSPGRRMSWRAGCVPDQEVSGLSSGSARGSGGHGACVLYLGPPAPQRGRAQLGSAGDLQGDLGGCEGRDTAPCGTLRVSPMVLPHRSPRAWAKFWCRFRSLRDSEVAFPTYAGCWS